MKNIIEITLNNKKEYLNKYNNNRISKELNDYILEECKTIELNNDIELHIDVKFKINDNEKHKLLDMIRENYGSSIREIEILLKKIYLLNILMILSGTVFLMFYFISSNIPVISEFILIIGWILIWEGIYNILYQSFKNAINIKRRKKLTNCKIIFNNK
ncbi:MAG: hypothetical protein E7166_00920 [Firmicutes bacterium]|nr:hypothetical protein [Bacillota bacterium]